MTPQQQQFLMNQFGQMKQHIDRVDVQLQKLHKRVDDLQKQVNEEVKVPQDLEDGSEEMSEGTG